MNCNVLDAQKCAWCFPKLYRFATGKKIMLFYLYGIFFANIESPHVQQVLV